MPDETTPFETIRLTNPAGNEFCSSRNFAKVLGYPDYRNFQSVIESARTAYLNSGQRVEDHFVEVTDMIEIGSGAQRPLGPEDHNDVPPLHALAQAQRRSGRPRRQGG